MANILITSSRMPFALDEVRKFGEAGCRVYTVDTFRSAPGSHSKYVTQRFLAPSPRYQSEAFLSRLLDIIRTKSIDLLVPCFEEAFYIAKHWDEFAALTHLFTSPLETLVRLHDKAALVGLAHELGVLTPKTIVVRDRASLRRAVREFPRYFARAAFSRGGVQLLTNRGPLAGATTVEDCDPTEENPWLVQEFIEGLDVCTFCIAHHGTIVAQSAYVHPKTMEHAGGIVLESIDAPKVHDIVRTFVEATGFHGQIGFDFLQVGDDVYLVECNPRPTAGVTLMPTQMFVDAVFDPKPGSPATAPAGVRCMFSGGLIRDMFVNLREAPSDLEVLLSDTPDVYARKGDFLPALYQFFSLAHIERYRRLHGDKGNRSDLLAGYFYDICWDGSPLT